MINYYLLTKPGIILGNLITLAAGFFLAAKGTIDILLFLSTLAGLAFVIASACVFNNYIDRHIDSKMQRTKDRPFVTGSISVRSGIAFALLLAILGNAILFYTTNILTVSVAAIGFFVYVVLYSFWKSRTIYGTAIGSIAGAIPPVVGYCAVSNRFDLGALILFAIMVLWQMPHFFAIAVFRFDDYVAANIPVLPIQKGMQRAKIHMTLYIIGFILASTMLTAYHYTGYTYLLVTTAVGLGWLLISLKGFKSTNDRQWGRQMFLVSLLMIMSSCLMISFDTVG